MDSTVDDLPHISRVPKEDQKSGRAANSAKRTDDELVRGVSEWVKKKFHRPDKKALMAKLWKGQWSSELVVNVVKSDHELGLIKSHNIKIHRLSDIILSLSTEKFGASGLNGGQLLPVIFHRLL